MKSKNNIKPHCHDCMEEFKMGVDVVMDGPLKGSYMQIVTICRQVRLKI